MADSGEVPFRRYYGTVDATPLFVMLAGSISSAPGDRETIEAIWPNVEAALRWIDEHGDRDRDGFVEYYRERTGARQPGLEGIARCDLPCRRHRAEGPIALGEVQGYVFAAKVIAAVPPAEPGAGQSRSEAEHLRQFEIAFWCEEIGTYALALDGEKRPCRVRTSNAGHALFTGIAARIARKGSRTRS